MCSERQAAASGWCSHHPAHRPSSAQLTPKPLPNPLPLSNLPRGLQPFSCSVNGRFLDVPDPKPLMMPLGKSEWGRQAGGWLLRNMMSPT